MAQVQADILDTRTNWAANPMEAFSGFVQSPAFQELGRRRPLVDETKKPYPLRLSSVKVYRAMFGKFLRWLEQEGHPFLEVTPEQIVAFLNDSRGAAIRASYIQSRYIQLLERVYNHLGQIPNPARDAVFSSPKGTGGKNRPTEVLNEKQALAFISALPGGSDPGPGWKQLRDRALLMTMLGAGLKVSEVVGLYLENIGNKQADGQIPITVSAAATGGTSKEHVALLQAFAVPELERWLSARKQTPFPDAQHLLFPASTKTLAKLDKATVYRHVRRTFENAGIAVTRRGGRTLRNTYGANEISQGADTSVLVDRLGLRNEDSIDTYALAAERRRIKHPEP